MLKTLSLHNFKCFVDRTIDLGPLTLVAGVNGVGKSTVFQAILLAYQSCEKGGIVLNGPWVELGRAEHVLSTRFVDDLFRIRVVADRGEAIETSGTFDKDAKRFVETPTTAEQAAHPRDAARLVFGGVPQYLTADRLGPRVTLAFSEESARSRDLGRRGEYTAHVLAQHWYEDLPNPDLAVRTERGSRALGAQVEAWMSKISPGVRIHPSSLASVDVSSLAFSFGIGEFSATEYRPTHVGFGLSYTLPVVAALLLAPKGGVVLLENPEAHLHPCGQTQLGRLIALVAASGAQVLVETHSDHLLDGVRIAVKEALLPPDDCAIHYFQRSPEGETVVTSPHIDKDGRLDEWPEGFFDEAEKNLEKLIPGEGW